MTQPDAQPDDAKDPAGLEWSVSCPRHGARAHIYIEGLDKSRPDLKQCSLHPGELPPSCDHACMGGLVIQPTAGSDEDTHADGDTEKLEDTQVLEGPAE